MNKKLLIALGQQGLLKEILGIHDIKQVAGELRGELRTERLKVRLGLSGYDGPCMLTKWILELH